MSFTLPTLLVTILSDRPPAIWWLSPGKGREAVGIKCEKRATTENQGSGVKYMSYGVYLDDRVCVLSDLT